MTDDFSANANTIGSVTVGGWVEGAIETAGDEDRFAVELEAGVTYRIDLEGSETGVGTLADPLLRWLHDSIGKGIRGTKNNNGGEGLNARQEFTPTESGTYYISANGKGSGTGTYRLSVTQENPPPQDEEAPVVPTIQVADVEAHEGEDTEIVFRVMLDIASAGPVTVHYATADGTAVAGEDYEATSGTLTFAAGETEKTVSVAILDDTVEDSGETFRLVLSSPSGAVLDDTEAVGTILNTEPPGQDLPADTTTTGSVSAGGTATGEIGVSGDRDWFEVILAADQLYRFDLTGRYKYENGDLVYMGSDYVRDPYLRGIYDSTGTYIPYTANNDGGIVANNDFTVLDNSVMFFRPETAGTYYVAAGAAGSQTGKYTVAVAAVTDDDYAKTPSAAGEVSVGGSTTGEIETVGDEDWYAVDLVAGQSYRIDVKGTPTSDGTLSNPELRGILKTDSEIESGFYPNSRNDDNSGAGMNSRLIFTPTEGGTHYLAVVAGGDRNGTGTYKVEVINLTEMDDFEAGTDTLGEADVGSTVDGTINHPGDRDWIAVDLEAGIVYKIELRGTEGDNDYSRLGNPKVWGIRDDNEDPVPYGIKHWEDYPLPAYISPESDGTYYVIVGANNYRNIGNYRLTVNEDNTIEDDFAADRGTSGRVSPYGGVNAKEYGRVDYGGDRDWFRIWLEADKTYQFDLRERLSEDGTKGVRDRLSDPYLYGIYDRRGDLIADTTNDNRVIPGAGWIHGSRVVFEPDRSGYYYVEAGAADNHLGQYELLADIKYELLADII